MMKNHTCIPARAGFTLFELALALVVIALIIGGVLGGEAMIHNAQLQTIIEDSDSYIKAVKLFKDKYHELPGDMPNAESFWGTDPNGCPNTPANIVPKIATCNGNGDGFIGDSTGTPVSGGTNANEIYRAWQQLANAGFIEGGYTGALSSRTLGNRPDPSINIPASKITGNGFTLLYAAPTTGNSWYYSANYHHVIVYGEPVMGSFNNTTWGAGLNTADALSIDQKMDDGIPGTGNVMSFSTVLLPNCATTNVASTAKYNTGYTKGPACSLIFITGF